MEADKTVDHIRGMMMIYSCLGVAYYPDDKVHYFIPLIN